MSRLTKKQGDLYYPTNENSIFPDDGSNAIRLLQVIGKYEDLQDKLGIDLLTLFKALENGIYYKTIKWEVYRIHNSCLELVYNFDEWELWVDNSKILDGLLIHLKDYKKTWWLKEGLKDD